eukprot:4212533-Ditylum_brightwellii.AAC.1
MDPSSLLFLGLDQSDIFLKGFKALLVKNEEEIHRVGYDLEDIGTHSICKGANTCASSGNTALPGVISISIRGVCVWTMGKVQDMYMLYKKSGDQYIQRLLTGLPVMLHLFVASHPQLTCLKSGNKDDTAFISCQTVLGTTVHHAIGTLFPSISLAAGILPTLQVSLASLCHNHQWLLDNVPEGTEVRCSPYFHLDELTSLSKE